jgi:phosphoribosylaminoimidazolecarboxamide formyltransferase / IMP cyclohydrolase
MNDLRPIRRALLSVSDKVGLVGFASGLLRHGIELVSTGGTQAALAAAGLPVRDVSSLTGFPEMMDGRLKTLHPKVHGGLLARRDDPAHRAAMQAHDIAPIDLLVVNLYPFEETVAKGAPYAECVENIDIGGPAMIRAAAKNHGDVAVVVDPDDYVPLIAELDGHDGATTGPLRQKLAQRAFARTAAYDAAIANWLAGATDAGHGPTRAFGGRLTGSLRYGENPHQSAGLYLSGEPRPGVAASRQVQGKALSFNNIADADAALELVAEFDSSRVAAVAIIKHANPCGVAEGSNLEQAYRAALRCDPVSAFGGIVAVNQRLDAAAARAVTSIFTEVIVAPDADEDAIAIVAGKKNLRLLLTGGLPDPRSAGTLVRSVAGGFLVQDRDTADIDQMDLKVVTNRQPTTAEMNDLKLAFRVCKHVKSNAIVLAKGGATVGIGAGQMSRVDAAHIAVRKAAEAAAAAGEPESLARSAVLASDAFFPFPDGLQIGIAAGVTAVIQPGGSMRDADVIAAADAAGLAMVFTGVRHFRH